MTATEPAPLPPGQDPEPGWGQALGTGAAGIALLHVEHAHAGTCGWDTVRQWATAMTRGTITAHPDACGLYRGAPAVAFTLNAAGHPGYATALTELDSHIATVTRHRLERAYERIDRGQLPALREFDLVSGLTGLGVYLLRRRHDEDLLRDVLAYLVRLARPLTVDSDVLPGWWTGHGPDDRPSPRWPGGHGNLGMAHGIAGPLALLSTATRREVTVDGQTDAIAEVCALLGQWRQGGQSPTWWPGTLTRAEWANRTVQQSGPQRPSWCYGTPGLARTQQLAGVALDDTQLKRDAEAALVGCIQDDTQLTQLSDASLCHGWAGLLQATWRAAADAGADSELAALVPDLLAGMEHHLDQHGPPPGDALLEGQAGIQLARHTTTANTPPKSHWDACLLLDG